MVCHEYELLMPVPSGVTPLLSVATHLADCDQMRPVRLYFVWCFRRVALLTMFATSVEQLVAWNTFVLHLFCTGEHVTDCLYATSQGRPDVHRILDQVHERGRIAVLTCGPTSLTDSVEGACRTCSNASRTFHVHTEQFAL